MDSNISTCNSGRFVSKAKAMKLLNISFPTLQQGIRDGVFKTIRTAAGRDKIFIASETGLDASNVVHALQAQGDLLMRLCKHFGLEVQL